MNTLHRAIMFAIASVALTGCQAYWDPEPTFGSSVNNAVQAQVQNPKAPMGYPKSVVGLDGKAANSSIESYQKTFERKQIQPTQTTGSLVGGSGTGLMVQ